MKEDQWIIQTIPTLLFQQIIMFRSHQRHLQRAQWEWIRLWCHPTIHLAQDHLELQLLGGLWRGFCEEKYTWNINCYVTLKFQHLFSLLTSIFCGIFYLMKWETFQFAQSALPIQMDMLFEMNDGFVEAMKLIGFFLFTIEWISNNQTFYWHKDRSSICINILELEMKFSTSKKLPQNF